MIRVIYETEKAVIYPEGGMSFYQYVQGIGWVVNEQPCSFIIHLALAARETAYPLLAAMCVAEVVEAKAPTQEWTTEEILARD